MFVRPPNNRTLSLGLDGSGGLVLGGSGLLLVELADGEGGKGLHEAGAVVGAGGIGEGEHGLGELTVELGGGVGELGLDVDELLDVVEGAVHLEDLAGRAHVFLGAVGELHAGGRAGELVGRGLPGDLGALVEEVAGVEVGDALLLDGTDAEGLLVLGVELGGENLNGEIGVLLLGGNVGIEIGLTGLDGGEDGLEGVTTLLHITLDLPVQLDLVTDVKVQREIEKATDTLVKHGVKTLNDDDGSGLNGLGGVQSTVDVVVDGLGDGLTVLQGLDLLVHEVEVVLALIEGGEARNLAAIAVVEMVVIEADDGGEVRDEGVGLPSAVAEATAEGSNCKKHDNTIHETKKEKYAHCK